MTVCHVFFVRSHPWEVSTLSSRGKVCTPIGPITGPLSLPPGPLPAGPFPALALGRLGQGHWPRVQRAYHVPQVVPTNGGRVPLYTGGNFTCVGRPLKSPELVPPPILGLEPLSRLSSAGVTMRNTEASLTLPLPVLPRSRSTVRLGFPTPAVCLRPHRYQGRPHRAGTEGTTSGLNHPFFDVQ